MRYTVRMLGDNQFEAAKRYILLAPVMKPQIVENDQYIQLKEIVNLTDYAEVRRRMLEFKERNNMNRTKSYDPPVGYTPLMF